MPSVTSQSPNRYDVFNGDADGICALHQYRLSRPETERILVTGVKRDIRLLDRIEPASDSHLAVFDISLDANRKALIALLEGGSQVAYWDHHFAGTIPEHPGLIAHIDPSPETCTSLIVNRLLDHAHHRWAICGAFGDNLEQPARQLAAENGLDQDQTNRLKEIGELLNYNGYGSTIEDLFYPPDELYRIVSDYPDPLTFFTEEETLKTLRTGFENDMHQALSQPEFERRGRNRVYRLPDAPWARRVSGVFANLKARENPAGAHALITDNQDGTLRVSVRAPLADKRDAELLCRRFPTGGGRAAAAGINVLPETQLDEFLDAFTKTYS